MKKKTNTNAQLLAEIEDLRRRLEEAEETLRAIHEGEVDALVLSKPEGEVVFTLKGAETPYRVFVEAMNEGAATLDPEGTILYCNNRLAEVLETPINRVIGSSCFEFIPPKHQPDFESAFEKGKHEDTTADIFLKGKDHAIVPVHLSFSRLETQESPVICMVAMDLTEHNRLEEELRQLNAQLEQRVQDRTSELRESEQRWATTLASIGDAVIATDVEGRIRFMNPVAEELTGWTLSEASQKPVRQVFKIISEHTRLEVADPVTKVLQTGKISGLANHTLLVRKDGTEVAIDDSGAPIRDENGKITGVVLVFRDITQRRRTEQVLRETTERLAIATKAAKLGIHDYDVTSGMIRWDKYVRGLWGVAPDQPITYELFISGLHPDDRASAQAAVEKALDPTRDGSYYAEYRVVNRTDDIIRWIAATGQTFFENGRAVRLVGTVADITERKRAEDALTESEQRYRGIVETAEEGIATHNPDGTITYVNQRMADMLGYSREEIIGRSSLDFVPEEEREALIRAQESLKEQGSFSKERKLRRKDGSILWTIVNVSPRRDGAGNFLGYLAMHTDITERKLAEEALRLSEEKFALSFANNPAAIAMTRLEDGLFLEVNNTWVALNGYSREEAIGHFAREMHIWPTTEASSRFIKELQEKGSLHGWEQEFFKKSGEVFVTQLSAQVLTLRGQKVILSTFVDITEQKRAEDALKKAHDTLEKRIQERTSELSEAVERLRVENIQRKQLEDTLRQSENQVRFFASQCLTAQETERKRVAGELHDSIAASLGAMKFRIDKFIDETKRGNAAIESLQELGSRLTEINSDVRRIMADLRPSILDDLGVTAAINWYCREYEKTYSHISVDKRIAVLEPDVPDSMKTPIFRISQEAMNNIAKHSQASSVTVSLRKEDNNIELTIKDNGRGFDLNHVRKGLGLSTMRERAQLSGGTFDIKSATGKGTIIRVSWPTP